ncbi:hypothetical protein GS582_35740 [Rhodococcus hoagii]|nr:hypothetical protein [Prescottella equi]
MGAHALQSAQLRERRPQCRRGPAGDRPDRSTGHRHLDDAERARLCGDRHCRATRRDRSARRGVGHGAVQFRDGGANIGAPVPVVDGSASLSYAFGSLGAHSITAVYSGGAGFASSTSEARTVTVTPPVVATSTTVTVPPTATTDLAVDLVAAVTPVGASGTVQFKDGASEIGAPVPVTGGVATLPHAFTTTGAHSVTAVYSGGAGFGPSTSSARTVTVSEPMPDAVATVTTLTAPGAAEVGSPVTLSATVSPAPVDGTVQFGTERRISVLRCLFRAESQACPIPSPGVART